MAVAGLAVLLGAPSVCRGSDDTIEGQVRTTTGAPLPSVIRVRLEVAEDIVVEQQLADSTGKFAFYELKGQTYRVIVTADGFQPAAADVDMNYVASRFPTIYLIPAKPKKTPPPPAESVTDLAAPKKARKEFEQGYKAMSENDLTAARQHLEKAVAQDPCFARALTGLGMVLSLEHDLPNAESSFKKSIQCDGEFLEAYVQLDTLLDSEKKYAEGQSVLEQGLRLAPSDWRLHYGLGMEQHHLGKYKEAADEFRKAESLSSDVPPEGHLLLADSYLELKDYNHAAVEMQSYLQEVPNGPLADQTRAMLQRLVSARKQNAEATKGAPKE